MQVFGLPGYVIRRGREASRLIDAHSLDPEAATRRDAVLRWRGVLAQGLSAVAVAVPRATRYRWEKCPQHRSHRPHKLCAPRWNPVLVQTIERLRLDNPVWGKRQFGPFLRTQGQAVSDASVGSSRSLSSAVPRAPAPAVPTPGGAVQIDTLCLTPISGKTVKPFTAIDRLSRWTAAKATAQSATLFLVKLSTPHSSPSRPPRSPEFNGCVERMPATWRYEFCAIYDPPHQISV